MVGNIPENWTDDEGNSCTLLSVVKDRGETLIVYCIENQEDKREYCLDFLNEILNSISAAENITTR